MRLSRMRRLDIHRAFPEAVVGRGRVQTDGARRHAPSSSRRFRKEARQGGYCSGRSDRQRILSRRGDRAARQASRDRGPQAGAYPTQALRRQVTRRTRSSGRPCGRSSPAGTARRSPSPLLRTMSSQEGQAPRRPDSKRRALADLTNRLSIRRCFGSMPI